MERGRILGVVLLAAVTAGAIGYAASRQAEERAAAETAYQAYLDALPLAEAEGEPCSPNGRFLVRPAGESAAEGLAPRGFLTVGGAARIPVIYLDPGGASLLGNGLREKIFRQVSSLAPPERL